MSTPGFVLKCLGYPELRTRDGRTVRIRVKKHLALLVFLAVERRRPHDRDRLVELLWSGASRERGRHSCATALSVLRTTFGRDALVSVRAGLRFAPAALELDLDHLAAGTVVGADGEALIEVDGFLAGFDIDDSPEFQLWKDREHGRRLPAIHAGLLTLIDHGRRRGSHDEIMQRAERLLALDHLAEEGIRARMEAMALVGDRVSALRIFDEWKTQLLDELGAEPSMLVEGMASQLRKRGWEPREPNPLPAVPAEQWRDRTFVGRQPEYRQLYETWESVHHYRPRHFLISGDSGVGKTTLAQRLVTAAGLEGASVARVQCYEMEQRIPFAAIGGLVAGLLGRPGAAATSPESLAEVARVVPRLRAHFPNLPEPKQSEGESARILFAEGVIAFLEAIMDERPVLLVIDDLHYADEASTAVLHFVLRRLPATRSLIVLTMRTDGRLSPNAKRFLKGTPPGLVQRVDLGPLNRDECDAILRDLLGHHSPIGSIERRALLNASRGYPLILELLADDWRANGSTSLALALKAMTVELHPGALPPPPTVDHIAARLLSGLGRRTRQALTVAAVAGRHTTDTCLLRTIGLSGSQAHEGLSELMARRVLRDVGGGMEFVNDLLRASIYQRTPQATRRSLHGALARRALDGGITMTSIELAWHLMRANRADDAAEHLIRGAREAVLTGAPDDAIQAVRSGLAQIPPSRRSEANAVLAAAYHEIGQWNDSLAAIAAAGTWTYGDSTKLRVLQLEAQWRAGNLARHEYSAVTDELIDIARSERPGVGKALALAASLSGAILDEVKLQSIRALALDAVCGELFDDADRLTALAVAAFYQRDLVDAKKWATDAMARLQERCTVNAAIVQLGMGLGVIASSLGDYEGALQHQHRARVSANQIGNEQLGYQAVANASLAELRLGDYTSILERVDRYEDCHAMRANPALVTHSVNLHYATCCALAITGKRSDAKDHLSRGLSEIPTSGSALWLEQVWTLYKADIHWLCGEPAKARHEAERAVAGDSLPASKGATGSFFRWMALLGGSQRQRQSLVAAFAARDRLDLLDRVEVGAAVAALAESRDSRLVEEAIVDFGLIGGRLPHPTLNFLAQFTPFLAGLHPRS